MRYTPRAERLLRHAERGAREHGHDYVGTEHVLLGLLAEPAGIAGQVLAGLDVADEAAALTEEWMTPPGSTRPST
jgi:ATP-dependent Clp protease ATP-binding subunit ClpC